MSVPAYVGAILVASAVAFTLALWLRADDQRLAPRLLVYWAAIQGLTGLLVVAHVLAPSVTAARNLYALNAVVSTVSPVLIFLFTVAYTGRTRWLSRRVLAVFAGWYLLLAGVVLTDPLLGLAYSEYVTVSEPFTYVFGWPTPLFSALTFPLWLLTVAPLVLLGARAISDTGVTRAQSLSLLAGFFVPMVVLAVWMGGQVPGPVNGAFVVGSAVTIALIAWAVRRYHLFDLVPLAREMVFDELDDAVIVVDRQLRLLDYNRTASEMFPGLDGAGGEDIETLLPQLVENRESDAPFVQSFTLYRRAELRVYDLVVTRLPTENRFQGYGLVVRDTTDQRRQLRDLEQQTTQLERFASTLSHDIRNPLSVAQGHIELAMEDGDRESLVKAQDAVERIEQIVDDLLRLTREGQTIDERQFVTLASVVEAAWKTTDTGDATLIVEFDDEGVYADETRLRNVFENLFRNALEFGGPTVTVRVGPHSDGFYVEDDGPGIPVDQRDRVFEYEYTTTNEGTGLGLAIVDSIARAHGWTVEATQGRDGGARLLFTGVDVVTPQSETAHSLDDVGLPSSD